MSFWNIWLIFRHLINSFEKTFVFFLHITSYRFCQNSNYWSSIIRHISNSMFFLIIEFGLFIVISQNVWSNFIFNFRLIIGLKTFIIFNGCWMDVWILFVLLRNFTKYICYSLILIFLIFIGDFLVRRFSLIDISINNKFFKILRF